MSNRLFISLVIVFLTLRNATVLVRQQQRADDYAARSGSDSALSDRPSSSWGDDTVRGGSGITNNNTRANRLSYIRPRGDQDSLLSIFEGLTNGSGHDASGGDNNAQLPRTPRQIALKYGIPRTPRNVTCDRDGTTRIGWIPNAVHPPEDLEPDSLSNASAFPHAHQGRIPKVIYQSWKTNELSYANCLNVLRWSEMNPEYDYLLFDDRAVDDFIRMEYGREVFGSYACVKVGAAKCDVWRLLVIYLFGGVYFDADVKLLTPLREWDWGDRDVVTARSCRLRKHPGGCAHQWGLM